MRIVVPIPLGAYKYAHLIYLARRRVGLIFRHRDRYDNLSTWH
jgi:hypothetical protein